MVQGEKLRKLLGQERDRIAERVSSLESQIDTLLGARRGSNDDDEHDPEGVPLSAEWSMLTGLLEAARANQLQVVEAFHRLDTGTYGTCTSCQQPIPVAQLEVRPFRSQCVACAS